MAGAARGVSAVVYGALDENATDLSLLLMLQKRLTVRGYDVEVISDDEQLARALAFTVSSAAPSARAWTPHSTPIGSLMPTSTWRTEAPSGRSWSRTFASEHHRDDARSRREAARGDRATCK